MDDNEMDDLLHETFSGGKEREFRSSAEIDEQRKEKEAQEKKLTKGSDKPENLEDNMTIEEHYALAKK